VVRDSSVRKNIVTGIAVLVLIVIALYFVLGSRGCGPSVSNMQEERDIPGLVAMLQGDDPMRAGDAATSLRELADPASVEPLIEIIEAEPFSPAAGHAVEVLTAIGDKRAVPAIISILETTPSASERSRVERYEQPAAIEALGKFADPRAAGPIVDWVKENGPPLYVSGDERAAVDEALLAMGSGSVDPLIALAAYDGASGSARKWAVGLLGDIGDPASASALLGLLDTLVVRDTVLVSLAKLGSGAVDALLAGLKSDDWVVVSYSARALGQIGDKAAEADLLALMTSNAEEPGASNARLAASDALALINKDAPARLVEWLGAEETVSIYYGLIHLGIPETETPLLEAFDQHANKVMAEHFLNSGNTALSGAAKKWAKANGFDVMTFSNLPAGDTGWGSLGGE
jgi:HEAT repeat protein